MRKSNFLTYGYALARIEPETRNVSVISKVHGYMRLIRLEGEAVVFATTAYSDDTKTIPLP